MATEIQQQVTILVVDDSQANLRLLQSILKDQGYRILPVLSGELALQIVPQELPDLILLDILMPEIDGYEVCRRLKAAAATRDIPVIFLSSLMEIDHKLKGFAIGGADYITKPFQVEEVLARVNTQLTIRRLYRELQQETERFQQLADVTFEGLLIHADGRILAANATLSRLTGYRPAELVGMTAWELAAPEAQAEIRARWQSSAEELYEIQARKCDGTSFPAEVHSRPIVWQGAPARMTAIRDLTTRLQLEWENRSLRVTLDDRDRFGELVGKSPAMKKVYQRLISAAAADAAVIIYGETGVGKELAARTIFALREHHKKAFVPVNCAAIPENLFESQFFGYRKGAFTGADRDTRGYFEQAQGGVLFLDEVGELSLTMQAKLLRVLNDYSYTPVGAQTNRTADVCIIAATNRELRELVRTGKMREDLFHRLHVLAIELPPLRDRKEDIPLLIAHFLAQRVPSGTSLPDLPPEIMARFTAYNWPGNVRELYNEVQRYLTTGEVELHGGRALTPANGQLAGLNLSHGAFEEVIAAVEKHLIAQALAQTNGNKLKAAERLRLPLRTFHRKIKQYQL